MGVPTLYFDEHAAMDALRQFVTSVLPIAAVDVYRARPAASPGKWTLSVVLAPVTPIPVVQSRTGEEKTGLQSQAWKVTIVSAAPGAWAVTVLGLQTVPFVAGPADTPATIATALAQAVGLLGLPVGVQPPTPATPNAFGISGHVGVSLGVLASLVPAGGAVQLKVVDDNIRRAVVNWGVWTIRAVVRDVDPAGGATLSQVGPAAEKLRLSMQASSIPVTNGLAYPYLRDRLQEATLSWRRTLGPFNADVNDGGVWARGCALDFEFDVPPVLLHDLPSLDTIGLKEGWLVVGPVS